MPSESLAAGSARHRKATCENCKHTICVVIIDGEQVVTDPELITVISDNPRDRTARTRVSGRRLHADSCERLKRIAERDAIRKERKAWDAKQARTAKGARTRGM